jgi:hypothetical protein
VKRCILPAFSAYAGGLNWCDPAFAGLFAEDAGPLVVERHNRGFTLIHAESCVPSDATISSTSSRIIAEAAISWAGV